MCNVLNVTFEVENGINDQSSNPGQSFFAICFALRTQGKF